MEQTRHMTLTWQTVEKLVADIVKMVDSYLEEERFERNRATFDSYDTMASVETENGETLEVGIEMNIEWHNRQHSKTLVYTEIGFAQAHSLEARDEYDDIVIIDNEKEVLEAVMDGIRRYRLEYYIEETPSYY